MNKGILIGVVVAVLVGLGVLGFFLLNKSNSSTNPPGSMMEQSSGKTFRDLMGLNNQECSFSDESGNSGVIYAASGKVRGDFMAESMQTHMISDGADVYLWFDGAESGYKMSFSSMDEASMEGTSTTETPQTVDFDSKVDYECKGWRVDNSKFALPNMEFNDFSKMMEDASSMMEDTSLPEAGEELDLSSQCSTCNTLPESARAQCLQALGCN